MFGFGRSAQEKAVIDITAAQFSSLGIPAKEAVGFATKLVDEVLSELRSRGVDPFKTTQWNDLSAKREFVEPRLTAGLTIDDMKTYWTRPLLVVFCERKILENCNFLVVDMAYQQGKDPVAAGQYYKKTFARYGDPKLWDGSDKYNTGLREVDADIYPEFLARIDAWKRRMSSAEVDRLIEQHGTLNAAVRHLVAVKAL